LSLGRNSTHFYGVCGNVLRQDGALFNPAVKIKTAIRPRKQRLF
jgi:hypothetical protein